MGTFIENKVPQKYFFSKNSFDKSWSLSPIFFKGKKNWKDFDEFSTLKMSSKIRILRCLRRLFIILVSLTVTLFSEKMLISTKCIDMVSCLIRTKNLERTLVIIVRSESDIFLTA